MEKVCLSCGNHYDAQSQNCPKCFNGNAYMSAPFNDAESLLDVWSRTDEAYQHVQIAESLISGGQYELAKKELNTAISIDPNYDFSYATMGMLYVGQKKYQEAIPWFQKVLELQPRECKGITEILALILVGYQRVDEAIEILDRKLHFCPGDPHAQETLDYIINRDLEKD